MCICPIIVKDVKNVEKSPFWSLSRGFCQIFDDFGFGFKKFGIRNKVSVSVLENLVSEKKSRFRFQKIWYQKKSLGIGFGKFGIGKKVSVSVSVKILVSSFSAPNTTCGNFFSFRNVHFLPIQSLWSAYILPKMLGLHVIYQQEFIF